MDSKQTLFKVVAYVTRNIGSGGELLVFTHRDYPEAGLQVPAGTVEEGEGIEAALLREVEEESGLTSLKISRKLGVYNWVHPTNGRLHVRHVFHLTAPYETPEQWQWVETSGGEVSELEGYVFCFRWVSLADEIELAGSQGDYLDGIR